MNNKPIEWMVGEVARGRMNRREFMGRCAAFGLSAAVASTLLSRQGVAGEPMKGGEVVIGSPQASATETFDPAKLVNWSDVQRAYQIYNRLTNLDRDLNVVPNLAVEWEAREQASIWTFKLREGVEWHDGKPFTAADVIYSFNEHIKPDSESSAKPLLEAIVDIRADGDHVVTFELSAGNADFATLVGHTYMTAIIQDGWKDGDPVVGTGAYRLVEFEPGQRSVVEKFENYWNEDAGHVQSIVTVGITDNTTRSNAIRTGDIDLAARVDPKVASLLDESEGVGVYSTPTGSWFGWAAMVDRSPGDSLDLRLALKHAVDRQYLVDNTMLGHGLVGNDFPVNPGLPTYCHDIVQHDYDPERARFHWDRAGFSSVTIDVANTAHATAVDCSTILQEQAREIGMDIQLNRVPEDGYWSHTWMQTPIFVTGWSSRPTADAILTIAHSCATGWNETAWCNERFDELLAMGRLETDPDRRLEIYCEACTLLHDDGGIIVPFFTNDITAVRNRIQNYQGSSAAEMGAGWPYEEIWIDDSQA